MKRSIATSLLLGSLALGGCSWDGNIENEIDTIQLELKKIDTAIKENQQKIADTLNGNPDTTQTDSVRKARETPIDKNRLREESQITATLDTIRKNAEIQISQLSKNHKNPNPSADKESHTKPEKPTVRTQPKTTPKTPNQTPTNTTHNPRNIPTTRDTTPQPIDPPKTDTLSNPPKRDVREEILENPGKEISEKERNQILNDINPDLETPGYAATPKPPQEKSNEKQITPPDDTPQEKESLETPTATTNPIKIFKNTVKSIRGKFKKTKK